MKYTLSYTIDYSYHIETYHYNIEADNDKDALKQAKEFMLHVTNRKVISAELVIIEKTCDGIICDNIAHYVRGCVWKYDER